MNTQIRNILFAVSVGVLVGCATVPITNRRQVTLIPSNQMLSLSSQQYKQVLDESKVSGDAGKNRMLNDVGQRIASSVDEFYTEKGMTNDFSWEFHLIEDDNMVNAWCMPGGKIAFYTGILKFTQNDAGVAAVMGHEVAHAIAQHGNERMSQQMITNFGTTAVAKMIEEKPAMTQQIFNTAVGVGAQYGILLPYGRLQESEADRIGLILMAKAGYDPRQAIEFWKRMRDAKSSAPPEFLSTHPSDQRRINDLKKHLPEALTHYRGSSS